MRKSIILISIAAVLGVGSFWTFHQKSSPNSEVHMSPLRSPASVEHALNESKDSSGNEETYEFEREVVATLASAQSQKEFAHVNYRGTFQLFWRSKTTAQVQFLLEDGTSSQVAFEFDLKSPWTLGELRTGIPQNDTQEDTVNLMKDFASIYAFRSLQDTSGPFEAKFQETNTQIAKQILKQKIRYTNASMNRVKITKSHHTVEMKNDSTLSLVKGMEQTEVEFGKGSTLKTLSRYSLTRKTLGSKMPSFKLADASALRPESLLLSQRQNHPQVNWSNTMSELGAFATLSSSGRLNVFHDLVNGMKNDPSRLNEFNTWMTNHFKEADVMTFGIGVLATAGSPEAQKTLLGLYRNISESRHLVLNAMATTDAAITPETRAFLVDIAGEKQKNPDLSMNAALALGSAMKKDVLPGEDQKMIQWYAASANPEEKTLYLDAMGNSGSSTFVPELEKALGSTDEDIREKAAFAARFMKAEDAQTLVSLAYEDSSIKVKTAAIKAISFQKNVAPFQTILNRCVGEKNDLSRVCNQILNSISG